MADLHAFVTTANHFEGYRIVRGYGVVRGVTVRSRSIFGTIGAGFQSLAGGRIGLYVTLAEQTRKEAYDLMIQHASEAGANAIVGMRYDASEVAQGITEVIAYGTAVWIEPVPKS
jgi:uncharacterized protein YbjQ (UPF0145 family)